MKGTGNRAQILGGSDRSEFGIPTKSHSTNTAFPPASSRLDLLSIHQPFFFRPETFSSEWIGVTSGHLHSTSLLDLVSTSPGAKSLEGSLPITQPHPISSDSALLRRVQLSTEYALIVVIPYGDREGGGGAAAAD